MPSFPREQILAIQAAGKTEDNLFITGSGGTGKSRVLKLVKESIKKKMLIVAVTGLAAIQVEGFTIDSVFKTAGISDLSKVTKRHIPKDDFEVLIIEEISMVSKQMFEYIDSVLRIKTNINSPMGGIRIIVFGDFYQLPPLGKVDSKLVAQPYAYQSNIWKVLNFRTFELKVSMRCFEQDDIKILNAIRIGDENPDVIQRLNALTIPSDIADKLVGYVHLFFSKSAANRYNKKMLKDIKLEMHQFKAVINESLKADFSNVPLDLIVKVGARVMCIKNDTYNDILVCNGECGIVDEIHDSSISVIMDDGRKVLFTDKTWYSYKSGKKIFAITQIPLTLAWGMTINKAQGLTLNKVVAHVTSDMYPGQAYVAISRVRKLNNLRLVNYKPNTNCIVSYI
jgi:ATP-dependent exoDNAse (exonuclease V) alpha subunit